MKKIALPLLFVLSLSTGYAQISIDVGDMPSAGDTYRVSNGLITPTIDPTLTGASYTWDFSTLQPVSQEVDSFVSVNSTGAIYSVVFSNISINPYRSNMAVKGPNFPTLPQISVSDVYYFYYNSTGSFVQTGYGANINGISTPLPFSNKDKIYDFNLYFGKIDTSDSDYQINIPGLGFYGHEQRRINEVDGWGTLITPFGTFNSLRVKSVINSHDSLYLDTLGIGFGFQNAPVTEYKWLSDQSGIPRLQINTTSNFGTEIITSIRYRDSLRVLSGLPSVETASGYGITLYPNPASDQIGMDIVSAADEQVTISLLTTEGRFISEFFKGRLNEGKNRLIANLGPLQLSTGNYLVEVKGQQQSKTVRLVVVK